MTTRTLAEYDPVRKRGREGIALVVALGCLAMLTIMAVGFAIAMRTERIASASHMQITQARHLTHAALADFMRRTETDLVGNDVAPDWIINRIADGDDMIVIPEARLHIPDAVFPNDNEMRAGWNDVNAGALRGRYSWVVINISACIDANYAGGLRDRHPNNLETPPGENPKELQIDMLAEITSAMAFDSSRSSLHRFETVAELNALAPSGFRRPARYLVTHSYFPGFDDVPNARNGLLNVNNELFEVSTQRDMFAMAFRDMIWEISMYHPDPEVNDVQTMEVRLNASQARAIADGLRGRTYSGGPAQPPSDFIDRLRDVVRNDVLPGIDPPSPYIIQVNESLDDFMDKCQNLFSNRQQLFIVVLAGQVLSEDGERVMADSRALAVVWRDPFENNDAFVPFFKWLDE